MRFTNRAEAGRMLARKLTGYEGRTDVVVLALPRGGVPVAYEIARELHAPLDVFLVRKLGLPGHEELAMGALASGGVRVLNEEVVRVLDVRGKTVILVDDGLATGATMRAAVAALRQRAPARIVVAVPVGAPETCAELGEHADETVCGLTPDPFRAVGLWYRDFAQTTDEEVRDLLARAAREDHPEPAGDFR